MASTSRDFGPVKKKRRQEELLMTKSSDKASEVEVNINDKLPDEILMEVLSFCSLAELLYMRNVCQHWSDVIERMLAVKKEIIVPKSPYEPNASAVDRYILTPDVFETALSLCPALSVLDMRNAVDFSLRDMRFVQTVTTHCRQLKVLKLSNLYSGTCRVDASLTLARGLPLLEEFTAGIEAEMLTNKFLRTLFASCKHLRVLEIFGSRRITSAPFVNTPVNMEKFSIDWTEKRVGTHIFDLLLKRCGDKLKHLTVVCWYENQDPAADCIVYISQFAHLESFVCENLIVMDCTGESIFKPLGQLSKLRSLVLKSIRCVHDDDIIEIVDGCPHLEHLTLTSVSEYYSCKALTSKGFMYIAKANNLRSLEVSYQKQFNGKCLQAFALGLPQLQELIARNNPNITEIGVKFLARHALELTKLVIDRYWNLRNVSVLQEFAKGSKKRRAEHILHFHFENTALSGTYHALSRGMKKKFADIPNLILYPGQNRLTSIPY